MIQELGPGKFISRDMDLTPKLEKKMSPYPRTMGRYNSSEMFFILHASRKTTPEQWLNPKKREIDEILKMWNGIGAHNQLEDLLGKENCEKKREFVYQGITLVAKGDYFPPEFSDEVWEFKTHEDVMEKCKPWHEHQVKLYTTMFEKDYGVIYQPVQHEKGVALKHIGTVRRDDDWFKNEMEMLYRFDQEVRAFVKSIA